MSTLFVNTITPNSGDTVTVSGSLTTTGKLTIGDATSDTVVLTAEISSSIIPDADDTYSLGSSAKQWKDLFIDGIANIDSASFDEIASALTPNVGGTHALGTMAKSWGSAHIHGLAHIHTASIAIVSSSLIPDGDDTYSLGSSTKQWKDLFVDGTANIDVIEGVASLTATQCTFTAITASNHVATTRLHAVNSASGITVSSNVTSSGAISSSGILTAASFVGAHTLTTAAQPNVTSVGTLAALTVADGATISGSNLRLEGSASIDSVGGLTFDKTVLANGDIATISGSNSAATLYVSQLQAQLDNGAFAEFKIQNTSIKATSHCLGAMVGGGGAINTITGSIVTVATLGAGTASLQIHNETGVNIADNSGFTASLLIL